MIMVAACDSGGDICLSNQMAVHALFYSSYYDDDDQTDTTVANISVVGLLNGEQLDSIIYDTDSIDNCYMPLSMFSDTTRYLIEIKKTATATSYMSDTISFVHNKELSFTSEDCGFIFDFEIENILYSSNSFIDSVAIIQSDIKYNDSYDTVEIYFY